VIIPLPKRFGVPARSTAEQNHFGSDRPALYEIVYAQPHPPFRVPGPRLRSVDREPYTFLNHFPKGEDGSEMHAFVYIIELDSFLQTVEGGSKTGLILFEGVRHLTVSDHFSGLLGYVQ